MASVAESPVERVEAAAEVDDLTLLARFLIHVDGFSRDWEMKNLHEKKVNVK